jgi:hypothetical protein
MLPTSLNPQPIAAVFWVPKNHAYYEFVIGRVAGVTSMLYGESNQAYIMASIVVK